MGNGSGVPHGAVVTQASGMVSVQAGCSFKEAIALMTERAERTHHTVDEIAQSVLDREIRFGE